jgi:hypothetical protein
LTDRVKIRRETILSVLTLVEQIDAAIDEVRAAGECRALSPAEARDAMVALDRARNLIEDARPVVASK